FVAALDGPRRVSGEDTVRLRVSYGIGGKREAGNGKRSATLAVTLGGGGGAGGSRRARSLSRTAEPSRRTSRFPFPVSRLLVGRRWLCGSKGCPPIPSRVTTPACSCWR